MLVSVLSYKYFCKTTLHLRSDKNILSTFPFLWSVMKHRLGFPFRTRHMPVRFTVTFTLLYCVLFSGATSLQPTDVTARLSATRIWYMPRWTVMLDDTEHCSWANIVSLTTTEVYRYRLAHVRDVFVHSVTKLRTCSYQLSRPAHAMYISDRKK